MALNNKGLLYTAGLSLLAVAVLTLALIASDIERMDTESTNIQAYAARAYYKTEDIRAGIDSTFNSWSGITLSAGEGEVSLEERLPNGMRDELEEKLEQLGEYYADDETFIEYGGLLDQAALYSSILDSGFTHPSYGEETLQGYSSLDKIMGIEVTINLTENVTSCDKDPAAPDTKAIRFTLTVNSPSGSCNLNRDIDAVEKTEVNINGGVIVEVGAYPNIDTPEDETYVSVNLINNQLNPITVKLGIKTTEKTNNPYLTTPVQVEVKNNAVEKNMEEVEISIR